MLNRQEEVVSHELELLVNCLWRLHNPSILTIGRNLQFLESYCRPGTTPGWHRAVELGIVPAVDQGAQSSPPVRVRGEPAADPAVNRPPVRYNPNDFDHGDDGEEEDEEEEEDSEDEAEDPNAMPFRRRSPLPVPVIIERNDQPVAQVFSYASRDNPSNKPTMYDKMESEGPRFPGSTDLWNSPDLRYANEWGKLTFKFLILAKPFLPILLLMVHVLLPNFLDYNRVVEEMAPEQRHLVRILASQCRSQELGDGPLFGARALAIVHPVTNAIVSHPIVRKYERPRVRIIHPTGGEEESMFDLPHGHPW